MITRKVNIIDTILNKMILFQMGIIEWLLMRDVIMHLYFLLFSLLSVVPIVAMHTKNWVPIRLPNGDIMWKAHDNSESIVIYEKPKRDKVTGKRYLHTNPSKATPLTYQEVDAYLEEIHPIKRAPKINLRDL